MVAVSAAVVLALGGAVTGLTASRALAAAAAAAPAGTGVPCGCLGCGGSADCLGRLVLRAAEPWYAVFFWNRSATSLPPSRRRLLVYTRADRGRSWAVARTVASTRLFAVGINGRAAMRGGAQDVCHSNSIQSQDAMQSKGEQMPHKKKIRVVKHVDKAVAA